MNFSNDVYLKMFYNNILDVLFYQKNVYEPEKPKTLKNH